MYDAMNKLLGQLSWMTGFCARVGGKERY